MPGMDHSGMGHSGMGHSGMDVPAGAATRAYMEAMDAMMSGMNAVTYTGDADADFLLMMIPHHQSAVDMSRALLKETDDPEVEAMAQAVIATQEAEIASMRSMLERMGVEGPARGCQVSAAKPARSSTRHGRPTTARWGLPDPGRVEDPGPVRRVAFAGAYRMLRSRISIFVGLPIASLDGLSLQRRLDEIGRVGEAEGAA